MEKRVAVIIGAGPAGLSAAYELLKKSDIKPIIIEKDAQVGGLAKTISHNGYRFDIGPHRFFSKSDRVNELWQEILPSPDDFLTINRLTRILFLRKFFNYPLDFSFKTLKNLGMIRLIKAGLSYGYYSIKPIKPEKNLADFFTNRFGGELYRTFFKDYTEKVWGIKCEEIPPDWGAQRVKGLSIWKTVAHAVKKIFSRDGINAVSTETSLTETFRYPALGAGQMYEEMANKIIQMGGEIYLNSNVLAIKTDGKKIIDVLAGDSRTGREQVFSGDYFISSMPIQELINKMNSDISADLKKINRGLVYRDYILVTILLKKINDPSTVNLLDNWLYIQEPDIKMGRLDIFNNFSEKLLKSPLDYTGLGAEYFATVGDSLWRKSDDELKILAGEELQKMNLGSMENIAESQVIRMEKAYPAYFGEYCHFNELKGYLNSFSNLYLIGRNGMHRYNNMDHSILTGLTSADLIINGDSDREKLWQINTEKEYHETKK